MYTSLLISAVDDLMNPTSGRCERGYQEWVKSFKEGKPDPVTDQRLAQRIQQLSLLLYTLTGKAVPDYLLDVEVPLTAEGKVAVGKGAKVVHVVRAPL